MQQVYTSTLLQLDLHKKNIFANFLFLKFCDVTQDDNKAIGDADTCDREESTPSPILTWVHPLSTDAHTDGTVSGTVQYSTDQASFVVISSDVR